MENLRILAENIDQKNEIISMFVSIGYNRESTCSYDNDDLMGIHVYADGDIQDVVMGDYCDKYHKEITIQQLRDMVVLKRNDVNDSTHINTRTNTPFLVQGSKEYFYLNNKWILSDSVNDLKPIEREEMKEFLVNHDGKWTLQLLDSDTEENSFRVAVPSGAKIATRDSDDGRIFFWVSLDSDEFYLKDEKIWSNNFDQTLNSYIKESGVAEIIWQRSETKSLNDTYAEIEQVRQETVKVTIDELKHRVYKKDVSHLDFIDVYRVLELFNVQSHAVGHAVKKLLCSGGRGAKDEAQDIQEAIDSLIRYQEMKNEDE